MWRRPLRGRQRASLCAPKPGVRAWRVTRVYRSQSNCTLSHGVLSLHLPELVLVNTLVTLFAGLMPVPGGVGVAEAGYTACLQAIGIPSAVAISTALAFRLVTFYLPPLWGSLAMGWLRRHQYV